MQSSELKKQIEYYLGDTNLERDEFFREKIEGDKDGYLDIAYFLNCNKIKQKGIKDIAVIAEAVDGSAEVELSECKKRIRRKDNKKLPAKQARVLRKRENKAATKEEKKGSEAQNGKEEEAPEVIRDEQGRIQFVPQDFENALIVNFLTEDQDEKADAEYKVNWKDFEQFIKDKFNKLKVVYSRADQYEGQMAISSHRVDKTQFETLIALKGEKIGTKNFNFSALKGEELKDFWQKQGGHFHYCCAPKMRLAKKLTKKTEEKKREERAARQKQSYTIAGQYYMDINKVKSKARAILNNMKDHEKLGEADAAFMTDLLKFHDKADEKAKDLDFFEVGAHPEFQKTRCFFVVKKDGSKEDFSVSKCVANLEIKSTGLDA